LSIESTDYAVDVKLAPSRLISYVWGIGSTAAHVAVPTPDNFMNALLNAGWEFVDYVYASSESGWNNVFFMPSTTPTVMDPSSMTQARDCWVGDFWNWWGFKNSTCDPGGTWVYFLPYDPYREFAIDTKTCKHFKIGLTPLETMNNLNAVISGYLNIALTHYPPDSLWWFYYINTTQGGSYCNGQMFADNGRQVSTNRLRDGGYIVRSAPSNTGAQIYLKITEYRDWSTNAIPIVIMHLAVGISATGPWHTFSIELTQADNEWCPPGFFSDPLWNYEIIANPYQVFVLGHPNPSYAYFDATCNPGQKALFACGCPWVDTDHIGTEVVKPMWATGCPTWLYGNRYANGIESESGGDVSFMNSLYWGGIYSWNGGDFVYDSRAICFVVPLALGGPLKTRKGHPIASHTWIGFPDPNDSSGTNPPGTYRMKIAGKLWDGMYVTSNNYDLLGVSNILNQPVHLVSRAFTATSFDYMQGSSIWVVGA
jgi:hypothetical protein